MGVGILLLTLIFLPWFIAELNRWVSDIVHHRKHYREWQEEEAHNKYLREKYPDETLSLAFILDFNEKTGWKDNEK